MKINLILVLLLFISTILSAQRFRQDISNFANNNALRNDFVVPKANDKVYVISTMKLYNYDPSDISSADDNEMVIVQGSRRWKCLNCASGGGSATLDSLNIFDGVNTFRYDSGELEIFNNEDNKAISMQNGRIHISRDGENPNQDTDVLIRSEIEDLIGSGGSSGSKWFYVNALADTTLLVSPSTTDYLLNITSGNVYERTFGYWNNIGSLKGATGATGAAGATWRFGSGVPDNSLGVNGDLYFRTNGEVYTKGSGIYSFQVSLVGPTGATGATGSAGADGADGAGITNGDKGDITVSGAFDTWAIDNSTITSAKIVDATIVAGDIANSTITATQIANETITSGKILDGTIVAGDLASNAVTTAKILDANVTTSKIADANVTVAKISATGTPSSTTYLRGDGSWSTPSGGGGGAVVTYLTITSNTATTTITHTFTAGKKYEVTLVGSYSTANAAFKPVLNFGGILSGDFRFKLYSYNSTSACTPFTYYGNDVTPDNTSCIMSATPATSTVLSFDLAVFIDDIPSTVAADLKIDNSLDSGTACTWQAGTTLIIREY